MKNTFLKPLLFLAIALVSAACENKEADQIQNGEFNRPYIVAQENAEEIAQELLGYTKATKHKLTISTTTVKDADQQPYFHIVNTSSTSSQNFVIISGDKRTAPVLGYGQEHVTIQDTPEAFHYWLNQFKTQIDEVRANQLEDLESLSNFKTRALQKSFTKKDSEHTPLLTTNWNQGCVYNSYSPSYGSSIDLNCNRNLPCDKAYTGCVSTCLSQMINFYQSMDNVNYELLKDSYTLADLDTPEGNEVGQLMRRVGDIMDMNYQCGGSGSPANYLLLQDYITQELGFTSNIYRKYYNRYGRYTLISELQSGNPIVFIGIDDNSNGGHFWIADGVKLTEDYEYYLHFNWGWGGNRDGWFLLGDFDSGNYNFSRSTQFYYNFRKETTETNW